MGQKKKDTAALPKQVADRIGRMFNLVFNRVVMYHLDHPSTHEAIVQLETALHQGLQYVSPLAVVLDREQIFVEEEPLDANVNAQRLVGHLKKVGVQSVSFERGVVARELTGFARTFGDPQAYATAEAMKQGLAQQGVRKVLINHVFFKKVTADEEVVGRGGKALPRGGGLGLTQVLIDTASEGKAPETPAPAPGLNEALLEDLFQSLTLTGLLEDPEAVSQRLLEADNQPQTSSPETAEPGAVLIHGIRLLRSKVESAPAGSEAPESRDKLLQAVFRLRESLRQRVEEKKQQGTLRIDEDLIREEMDELTDQVMVQLVREEYRRGQISVKRLAQIVRRMMPDARELRRFLPKLKEALLAEGMPLADYLQLIRELERELESEGLARILEEGADEIGLSVQDLIREIRRDPRSAAELIALAGEIRALGLQGDRDLLNQILVDYVERVGGWLALENVQHEGPGGVDRLQEIVSEIQGDFLTQLRRQLADDTLVEQVHQRVLQRREENVDELHKEWILRQFLSHAPQRPDVERLLEVIERRYPDPGKQREVLSSITQAMKAHGLDPQLLEAALAHRGQIEPGEADPEKVPKGMLKRPMLLFLLREEVKRGQCFEYLFSVLMISVRQATALRPVPIGLVQPHEIRNALMTKAAGYLREVDLMGALEANKILVLLPFTDEEGMQEMRRKIVEAVDGKEVAVRAVPMTVRVAIAEAAFHRDQFSHPQALLARLERELSQALKQ